MYAECGGIGGACEECRLRIVARWVGCVQSDPVWSLCGECPSRGEVGSDEAVPADRPSIGRVRGLGLDGYARPVWRGGRHGRQPLAWAGMITGDKGVIRLAVVAQRWVWWRAGFTGVAGVGGVGSAGVPRR